MTFIEAAKILKDGGKVRRASWEDWRVDIYVEEELGDINVLGKRKSGETLVLSHEKCNANKIWEEIPCFSIEDILANDWLIVEDKGDK